MIPFKGSLGSLKKLLARADTPSKEKGPVERKSVSGPLHWYQSWQGYSYSHFLVTQPIARALSLWLTCLLWVTPVLCQGMCWALRSHELQCWVSHFSFERSFPASSVLPFKNSSSQLCSLPFFTHLLLWVQLSSLQMALWPPYPVSPWPPAPGLHWRHLLLVSIQLSWHHLKLRIETSSSCPTQPSPLPSLSDLLLRI